jgi:hypothetical protein
MPAPASPPIWPENQAAAKTMNDERFASRKVTLDKQAAGEQLYGVVIPPAAPPEPATAPAEPAP